MQDISLHIMDIAQNAITANAGRIEISVTENPAVHSLEIIIRDDGCGMDEQTLHTALSRSPSRNPHERGRGIPLFKAACEKTGGKFHLTSEPGTGTAVKAVFLTNHPDMLPMGKIHETICLLIACNPDINFVYGGITLNEIR